VGPVEGWWVAGCGGWLGQPVPVLGKQFDRAVLAPADRGLDRRILRLVIARRTVPIARNGGNGRRDSRLVMVQR
jgi:hypothetical protein